MAIIPDTQNMIKGYAAQETIQEFFEPGRTDNALHTFSANGQDFVVANATHLHPTTYGHGQVRGRGFRAFHGGRKATRQITAQRKQWTPAILRIDR
jgi:hypothetical protein